MLRGKKIQDRYELQEPIGEGGMAEVWLARDTRLERDVAVKLLAPRLAEDAEFLVRFFTEAQVVARVNHYAVVDVLDFGEIEGRPYLVMEHVPGGALADLPERSVTPERAAEIGAEVARGLAAAHAQGLVHRDIKPGNILLDAAGRAKVADFGIASARGAEHLTATGAAIGSPHYISPEQVSGSSATPQADIYSLGVVLYELLAGQKPFDGDNVTAVAIARLDQDPPPPSHHAPDLGPEIDRVVMRCLARDPAYRYATALELAEALEHLHGDHDSNPSEVPFLVGAAPTPAGSRSPRVMAGGVVILLLLGFASAGILTSAKQGPPPAPPSDGPVAIESGRRPLAQSTPEMIAAAVPAPPPARPAPAVEEEKDPEERKARKDENRKPGPSPTPSALPTPSPSPSATPDPEDPAEDLDEKSDKDDAGVGEKNNTRNPSPGSGKAPTPAAP